MVKQVKDYFLEQVKRQGLNFVMLCIAVYFLYGEQKALQVRVHSLHQEVAECNDTIIEIYSTDHAEMRKVIIENTEAIRQLTR